MPRRLLALAVTALALVMSAGCADDVSPAARVGDTKISNSAFLDEVAEWAGNEQAVDPTTLADSPPGTYPLGLVSQLLQQRVGFELHNAEFKTLGLTLDDDVRDQALTAIFGDVAAAEAPFAAFSDKFAKSLTDDLARQFAVGEVLGDGYQTWVAEALAEADVEVNPRYGTWDRASGQIVPPEGPVEPAGVLTPAEL